MTTTPMAATSNPITQLKILRGPNCIFDSLYDYYKLFSFLCQLFIFTRLTHKTIYAIHILIYA